MLAAQSRTGVGHELLDRLAQSRECTDELFKIVKPDSLYERPIPERHRIVFYIGHLEAFDWNLFHERLLNLKSFHPEYDQLFAFGIDPVGGGLPSDQPADWPSLAEVGRYIRRVRESIDEKLEGAVLSSAQSSGQDFSATTLLNVAIEHRLMHAETLAYMLHQLPLDRKIAPPPRPELVVASVEPKMIDVPAGMASLGISRADAVFGWDNEFEAHAVNVPAFSIDQYKITNGQYLEFIAAGGYDNRALWKDADWNWRIQHNIGHPAFWHRDGEQWLYRTMFDDVLLPPDWPVFVSHAEASAYARWAGKSLPTEAQWHRAAYGAPDGSERQYPWGAAAPSAKRGNFDFHGWDPVPVGALPRRPKRVRSRRHARQWMGMDLNRVCPVFRLSAVLVLSRLLREFF